VGRYTIRYQGRELGRDANHEWARVRFNAYRGTEYIADMIPAKNFYIASQQPTTEVAIRTSLREDCTCPRRGEREMAPSPSRSS
jgi:cytochrome c biogenesis factor